MNSEELVMREEEFRAEPWNVFVDSVVFELMRELGGMGKRFKMEQRFSMLYGKREGNHRSLFIFVEHNSSTIYFEVYKEKVTLKVYSRENFNISIYTANRTIYETVFIILSLIGLDEDASSDLLYNRVRRSKITSYITDSLEKGKIL